MRITPKRLYLAAIAAGISVWSYTLVDPNLVLLPWKWFFNWQQQFWIWGSNRYLIAFLYLLLTAAWSYIWIMSKPPHLKSFWSGIKWILPIILLLFIGHNALSHDIFNYLFNAKMVIFYDANPHQQVAMDFTYDPWTRFMHNIHTAAPYGYAWTAWSLPAVALSGGIFTLAYVFMKWWMVVGLGLFFAAVWLLIKSQQLKPSRFWLVLANPLLLMETAMNGHNDVWMIAPALVALWLVKYKARYWWSLPLATLLWVFSWNIKLATIVLAPIILGLWMWERGLKQQIWAKNNFTLWLVNHWADWSAILMMIPLFTLRSQLFHPWYLIWTIAFLPLINWQWLRWVIIGLTITSLWRYIPWLINDLQYDAAVIWQMRFITWSGAVWGIIGWLVSHRFTKLNLPVRK